MPSIISHSPLSSIRSIAGSKCSRIISSIYFISLHHRLPTPNLKWIFNLSKNHCSLVQYPSIRKYMPSRRSIKLEPASSVHAPKLCGFLNRHSKIEYSFLLSRATASMYSTHLVSYKPSWINIYEECHNNQDLFKKQTFPQKKASKAGTPS